MASAGLSDIEEIEVLELRDTSGVNLLTGVGEEPWSHSQTECIRGSSGTNALMSASMVVQRSLSLMILAVAVSPR